MQEEKKEQEMYDVLQDQHLILLEQREKEKMEQIQQKIQNEKNSRDK